MNRLIAILDLKNIRVLAMYFKTMKNTVKPVLANTSVKCKKTHCVNLL